MTDDDRAPRPLWDRASLPSTVAIARATRVAALALVVVALVGLLAGPAAAGSVLGGGLAVLAVLWGSAQVLIAGARRLSPSLTLGLALAVYLVAVVGLLVLAVVLRAVGDGDVVRPPGVAAGILTVVVAWTVALLVVHVRHDRGPRKGRRAGPGNPV